MNATEQTMGRRASADGSVNVTDPEQFTVDAIAAIQRQIDKGHRLVREDWGADGIGPACAGCAWTLIAIDVHGVDKVGDAFDDGVPETEYDDDLGEDVATSSHDGERIVAALMDVRTDRVLDVVIGYDHDKSPSAEADAWVNAGRRIRDHFQRTGAL